MDLSGAASLAGLVALVIAASILTVGSLTLAANVAGTAFKTGKRTRNIGRNAKGELTYVDVDDYLTRDHRAETLRKRLSRYPGKLRWFFALSAVPTFIVFAGIAFRQLNIVRVGDKLVLAPAENAHFTFSSIPATIVSDWILPMTIFYCLAVVWFMIRFNKGLYAVYQALDIQTDVKGRNRST